MTEILTYLCLVALGPGALRVTPGKRGGGDLRLAHNHRMTTQDQEAWRAVWIHCWDPKGGVWEYPGHRRMNLAGLSTGASSKG
jgi:hypothetical protein